MLAVIRGSAINHDGRSNGLTAPNGPAQEAVIRAALANAGVAPHDVSYVEAHGTGTALGDPIEVQALAAVLAADRPPARSLLLGSLKANIGHLEGAAGIAGLIKVVLALRHQEIPPQIHMVTPNPHIPWDRLAVRVPTELTSWPATGGRPLAGLSSFGFSGTNAHVILEGPPVPVPTTAPANDRPLHLLTLSARSLPALQASAGRLASHVVNHAELAIGDVCFTANVGRAHLPHRLALVTASLEEAGADLARAAVGDHGPSVLIGHRSDHAAPEPVFLFTGQGAQYVHMGRELYQTQSTFRKALDTCHDILGGHLEIPLLSVLFPANGVTSPLDQTAYAQPALFALAYALTEVWRSWGVRPTAVMGHSVGEFAAACVAGVVSLEEGLRLVAERGRLMQELPPGAMSAVFAEEARVAAEIAPYVGQLEVAAVNGPEHVVISGEPAAIQDAEAHLEGAGITCRRLAVTRAFHSSMMDPILGAFEHAAAAVTYAAPRLDIVSNVTGQLASGGDLVSAAYWRRHLRERVRFAEGIDTLRARGARLFVEIGPHPVLLALGARGRPDAADAWLPSLRRGVGGWRSMLESLASLFVRGVAIDWMAFDAAHGRRRVALPTYPFQRQRYWGETGGSGQGGDGMPVPPEARGNQEDEASTSPLYYVAWTPAPSHPNTEATGLAAMPAIVEAVACRAVRAGAEYNLANCGEFLSEMDRLCAAYIVRAFDQLGVDLRSPKRLVAAGLPDRLGVTARHHRLFGRMLEILAEEGILRREGADWTVTAPTAWPAAPDAEALIAKFPEGRAQVAMTARCADHLADVLRGQCDPLPLLFAGGSFDEVEEFYSSSPIARAFNDLVAEVVATAVQRVPAGRRLRILEIGAGTGSTTLGLLRRLSPSTTEYVFTDVSPMFTARAAEKFAEFPFVRYERLDIELDPTTQDFARDGFDIVVAANVLHATADLRQTLHHVRQLVAPDGLLLLLETTTPQRYADLTVGLTEGWWRFADHDLRPSYPLLSRARWFSLLEEEGFAGTAVLPEIAEARDPLQHGAVIIARVPPADRRRALPPGSGRWLVFADGGGVAAQLARLLETRGDECVLVNPTEADGSALACRSIALDCAQSVRALLEDLVGPGSPPCRGIVHLCSLNLGALAAPGALLDDMHRYGPGGVLHVVQALTALDSAPPPLWLVTRGVHALDRERVAAQQAPVWGLGAVVALEHPELRCVRLDLDPEDTAQAAAAVFDELLQSGHESQVAVRGNTRYVARLRRGVTGAGATPPDSPIAVDGTYLITGGFGGLGLQVATWLVDQGCRSVVLLGRTGAVGSGLDVVRRLERMGAHVQIWQGDVTRSDDVVAVLEHIRRSQPPLRGVFHSVGVLDDGVLAQQDWSRFARVLAPKVVGALNLHTATLRDELSTFVMFSSAASVLGSAGQGNHAAANAFLDALAHERRAQGLPAISINWGPWAEVGAAAKRDLGDRLKAYGVHWITPGQGLAALETIVRANPSQAAVLSIDWSTFLAQFHDTAPPFFAELEPRRRARRTPTAVPARQRRPREESGDHLWDLRTAAPTVRKSMIVDIVRRAAARVLRLPLLDVELHESLVQLGLDSLMAVELRNSLDVEVAVALPLASFLDGSSVQGVAVQLLGRLSDRLEAAAPEVVADDAIAPEQAAQLLNELPTLSDGEVHRLLARMTGNGGEPR